MNFYIDQRSLISLRHTHIMSAQGRRRNNYYVSVLRYTLLTPRLQAFKVCLNSLISIIRDILHRQRNEDQKSYAKQPCLSLSVKDAKYLLFRLFLDINLTDKKYFRFFKSDVIKSRLYNCKI